MKFQTRERAPVGRLVAAVRYGGARHAARRALMRTWVGVYVIYVREVDAHQEARRNPPRPGLEAQDLTAESFAAYRAFAPRFNAAEIKRRIDAGHVCKTLWLNHRVVTAVWLRSDEIWLPTIGRAIPLRPSELYAYDAYTDPAYRRQGLAGVRSASITQYARELGVQHICAYVRAENTPAIRSVEGTGYRVAGRVRWICFGTQIRTFTSWSDPSFGDRKLRPAPDEHLLA